MELFSGLLLTVVVLAILAYFARELIAEELGRRHREIPWRFLCRRRPDARQARNRGGQQGGERLRVRIEGERWSANPAEGATLPAGTPVRVVAVNGLVLEVEPVAGEDDSSKVPDTADSEVARGH